jgi:tetratricopeptide (TPR) repeat protein
MTRATAIAAITLFCTLSAASAQAADQWIEVRSPHFLVTSNAGQGSATTLAWQLEQIRSAIAAIWPWAHVDLNKPLAVIAVKDEASMKALAPMYWERKGGVHPSSVWVGGADQNYLAIRTDVSAQDTADINPYVTSYFSYVSLILSHSVERQLPLWLSRGLAGVLSNTIIRNSKLLLGPPIPWHLRRLAEVSRLRLPQLLKIGSSSPEFTSDEGERTFDAESWAFVHFLMFGENSARWSKLDRFSKLVASGTDADVAFREALGPPEDLEPPFFNYLTRNLYSFKQVDVDASVKREGFTVRALTPADAASRRALFHAAMNRPIEGRAAIDEARKAGPAPESFVAEALLLDLAGKKEEAKTAYASAADGGSTSAYAYYRLASLLWTKDADHDTLARVETLLERATSLNMRYADAYSELAEVKSILGTGDPMGLVLRAISLEPSEAHHRLAAANILWRAKNYDEALKYAESALSVAKDDETRRRATETIDDLRRAKGGLVGEATEQHSKRRKGVTEPNGARR